MLKFKHLPRLGCTGYVHVCYRPQQIENNMRTVRIHDPEIEENASLRACASHVWFCWVLLVVIFSNFPKTQFGSFVLK